MNLRIIVLLLCMVTSSASAAVDKNRKLQVDIIATALQAPYIFVFDSDDADTLKYAAGTDVLAQGLKAISLVHGVMEEENQEVVDKIFELLKTGIHLGAFLESSDVFYASEAKALENKRFSKLLARHKFKLKMSFLIECLLRGASYYSHSKGEARYRDITSELANFVGCFRLVDRRDLKNFDASEVSTTEAQATEQAAKVEIESPKQPETKRMLA